MEIVMDSLAWSWDLKPRAGGAGPQSPVWCTLSLPLPLHCLCSLPEDALLYLLSLRYPPPPHRVSCSHFAICISAKIVAPPANPASDVVKRSLCCIALNLCSVFFLYQHLTKSVTLFEFYYNVYLLPNRLQAPWEQELSITHRCILSTQHGSGVWKVFRAVCLKTEKRVFKERP